MFDNTLIEVDDHAAGILVRAGQAFAFHALELPFQSLEGVTFPDAATAERAARRLTRRAAAERLAG
ncbi:hypothetical protein [Prosthecomicrobium pneumaticum]|uniref:Uncharacterized protein n=1 Tax=Prosthecomicrobium pneumaticum TaxID=81895 RepID=A0A7W9CTV2_9HYPH|nr:hypothetical protein [Prosthecomicrobium pneumaticum]MBB5751775.1 hypothetical protein [Prosthecomicrobium pneumaticum]